MSIGPGSDYAVVRLIERCKQLEKRVFFRGIAPSHWINLTLRSQRIRRVTLVVIEETLTRACLDHSNECSEDQIFFIVSWIRYHAVSSACPDR